MGAIYRRELTAYFTSATAYVFLGVFTLFAGLFFTMTCISYNTTDLSGIFSNMFVILLFLLPILTMRLLSEEKKQKTDQCLLTSPVSLSGIVLGKYLAALTVYAMAHAIFLIYGLVLAVFSPVPWLSVMGNLAGMLLLGAAFLAVGLFVSSLTESQVIAAIGGFVAMMILYLMDFFATSIPVEFISKALQSLSFSTRYSEFTTGIFNISSVLFFISVAVVFNFFTIRILEKRRWS